MSKILTLLLIMFSLESAFGAPMARTELPLSEFADTEVTTNFAFSAWEPHQRQFAYELAFEATPSNNFEIAFDAADRPVARNGDRFAYDELGEGVEACIGTNTFEHAYDRAWNHTRWVHDGVEHLYLNNSLNQTTQEVVRVLHEDGDGSLVPGDSAVTNKLTWSAQGGLQRDGRFIYAFDAEDQLVSVTSAALTNGAIRVVNAYDYRRTGPMARAYWRVK